MNSEIWYTILVVQKDDVRAEALLHRQSRDSPRKSGRRVPVTAKYCDMICEGLALRRCYFPCREDDTFTLYVEGQMRYLTKRSYP